MENVDSLFALKCALASFLANYVVGVFHPLQLLKTRLQSHDGKEQNNLVPRYDGIVSGIKDIYRKEGLGGLFKGIHLTTFTSAVASSLFFLIYEHRKLHYEEMKIEITSAAGLASLEASILTTLMTQPFWVVKTRVLLNTDPNLSEFRNMKIQSRLLFQQHGLPGFYRGLVMNLGLALTGSVQMYIYEASKLLYEMVMGSTDGGQKSFICGGVSKLVSTVVTYPLTTIRTRIQQNQYVSNGKDKKYRSSWDVTRKITREQGLAGFFKGLSPNLIRGIPSRGVYFYFYQLFKKMLITTSAPSRQ